MKCYGIGLVMVAATAAIVAAGSARADVPPKSWYGAFPVPVIACDTEEEIAAIAKARDNGHDAMVEKFKELAATLGKGNAPACAYGNVGMVAAGENVPLPDSKDANEAPVSLWALHVGNSDVDFWILYGEVKAADTKPDVPKKADPTAFLFDNWNWIRTLQGV